MDDAPLKGIRVLSMEQAVALPVGTRHLADMGAEIIRVQSHARRAGSFAEIDLTRNKRQLALDLTKPGASEAFLRIATRCDVVAHNYTPRVVRQFGIDYESVRKLNQEVIYVSLTGFGTTGPWGERPLFGPGAEAVSGHNMLIGDPEAWPGRPGTIVYADTICGLNTAFAIIAALEERDRSGQGQHIDISLYETQVAMLGPVIAEAALGARPSRVGNDDVSFLIHGVFASRGLDRHIAVAVRHDQAEDLISAIQLPEATPAAFANAVADRDASEVAAVLQARGIAATPVADASDTATDPDFWERGYFGLVHRSKGGYSGEYPHMGPAWGGGPRVPMEESRPIGVDSAAILEELGGYSAAEVLDLKARGVFGEVEPTASASQGVEPIRVERGELSRIDENHDAWRRAAASARRDE